MEALKFMEGLGPRLNGPATIALAELLSAIPEEDWADRLAALARWERRLGARRARKAAAMRRYREKRGKR